MLKFYICCHLRKPRAVKVDMQRMSAIAGPPLRGAACSGGCSVAEGTLVAARCGFLGMG